MPPRIITVGIIVFWLAMTALLIQREVVPMMLAEASPNFQPDLTDEIGSPLVGWTIFRDGERVGSGTSRVTANNDATFELRSAFHFDKFSVGLAHLRTMENMYRVNPEGKLLAFSTTVSGNLGHKPGFGPPDFTGSVEGEVVNDTIEPRVALLGFEHKLDKIHLRQEGSIVNPMHLVNRLRGLRPGMTWKVKRVDALDAVLTQFGVAKSKRVPDLIATVKADKLNWDRKEFACNVIEYHEPGKEVNASTWVRRIDGLVLRQEATFGFKLTLERAPN
jgi:hypothetical protein